MPFGHFEMAVLWLSSRIHLRTVRLPTDRLILWLPSSNCSRGLMEARRLLYFVTGVVAAIPEARIRRVLLLVGRCSWGDCPHGVAYQRKLKYLELRPNGNSDNSRQLDLRGKHRYLQFRHNCYKVLFSDNNYRSYRSTPFYFPLTLS